MKILKIFLGITAGFIILYWGLVFTGIFPVTELVPGYTSWFMSFPLADLYFATTALISIALMNKNKQLAGVFVVMTGSAMIFLGLYALLYGANTGLLFILTTDEIIEIFIKLYCLTVGSYFIRRAWKGLIRPLQHTT